MLTKLQIQNFQAHAKLTVEFNPGVTTIVGASDVGKSAVLRALWWALANTPSGEAFVRHGTKGTMVRVHLGDDVVTRRRGGSTNTYELNGTELKAFGNKVPDVVQAVVNLGADNFQGQHDAPYWFADTAGAVSRALNAIIDLGVIDDALGIVVGKLNTARTRADLQVEELAKAKAERKATEWAAACNTEFKLVEQLHVDMVAKADRAVLLRQQLQAAKDHAATAARATQQRQGLVVVLKHCQAAGRAATKVAGLRSTIAAAKEAAAWADRPIPSKAALRRLATLCMLWKEHRDLRQTLANHLANVSKTDTKFRFAACKAGEARLAFEALEGVCPVCGKTL